MATRKAAVRQPKKSVTPAEAVRAATAKVRAPFEAVRAAQAKAETKTETKTEQKDG